MTLHAHLCRRWISLSMAIWLIGCTAAAPLPDRSAATPTAAATAATSEIKPELEKYFDGAPGTFVLYDLNRNQYLRYNPERSAERFLPASTFKILNSLISLETGVIPDENTVINWDGTAYAVPAWNQDHTLRSAIKDSVVWYYQELARRVGAERMQKYVDAAGYGNRDITGNIDSFWLDGALRISADEQVHFLKRLYQNNLPFSPRTLDIVKDILILDKTPVSRLSGKTGTQLRVKPSINWFVGYVEKDGNAYIFATNLELPEGVTDNTRAKEITLRILRDLELIPSH
ncbi:MAG TPA: class D beta-lactamase [Anaerolineae bacterium]|nr:class D beta-lactamase [Anaerolineae bacterium]